MLSLDSKLYIKAFNTIEPGQFIHLKINNELLLRRPFSIYDVLQNKKIEIIYQVVGQGTKLMRQLKPGKKLTLFGPLGKGFKLTPNTRHAILAGGGIGIAGLHLLLKYLVHSKCYNITVLLGARTKNQLYCLTDFKRLSTNIHVATEDGSVGIKGMVTDLLNKTINSQHGKPVIYSCGPIPMINAICNIVTKYNIPAQVSMESRMGCGIGLCRGCVCKVVKKPGSWDWATVCNEGPVFKADKLYRR